MERKRETERVGMERLGFSGTITLTLHIILANLKHFLCITLFFAFPFALNFFVLGPLLKTLRNFGAFISLLNKIRASHGHLDPSDFPPSDQQPPHIPLPLLFLLIIVPILVSLLCTLLVTFSVCRAYLHKSLDLKGSLRGVQKSSKNLILTVLVVYGVLVAYAIMAALVVAIIAAALSVMKANVKFPVAIMAVGVVGGALYMAVGFSLANTVAILEEEKGWEAISRSTYLIQGNRWRVLGLYSYYGALSEIVFVSMSVPEEGASVVWRWGSGALMVALQAFIAVCSVTSMVVVYMGSKSGHGEPLDTLLAASAQFGPPLQPAAESLDLETAAFAAAKNQLESMVENVGKSHLVV